MACFCTVFWVSAKRSNRQRKFAVRHLTMRLHITAPKRNTGCQEGFTTASSRALSGCPRSEGILEGWLGEGSNGAWKNEGRDVIRPRNASSSRLPLKPLPEEEFRVSKFWRGWSVTSSNYRTITGEVLQIEAIWSYKSTFTMYGKIRGAFFQKLHAASNNLPSDCRNTKPQDNLYYSR